MAKLLLAALLGAALATVASARTPERFSLLDKEYSSFGPTMTAKVIQDSADGRCFLIVFAGSNNIAIGPAVPCSH